MVNKRALLDVLLQDLESTLKTLIASANSARDAATNVESKAESKWDTFGLESSYLAGAQAKRAEELRKSIMRLNQINFSETERASSVENRALVRVAVDGESERIFFVLPMAGGSKILFEGNEYTVITFDSPLGSELQGKEVGDAVEIRQKGKLVEFEILGIDE